MRWRWFSMTARCALAALTIATAVVWPLSRWFPFDVELSHGWSFTVQDGLLRLKVFRVRSSLYVGIPGPPSSITDGVLYDLGFQWLSHNSVLLLYIRASVPIWSVLLILLTATAFAWRTPLRTTLRRRRGACPACGYARAGLPAAAACPECGAAPAA
jgi:hypothetical protein